MKDSSGDLKRETAAALSYFLGPITGVMFLILYKDKFVRFHAMQSTVLITGILVLQQILVLTVVLRRLVPLVSLVLIVLWLILVYKAWMGEEWEAPLVGKFVRKMI